MFYFVSQSRRDKVHPDKRAWQQEQEAELTISTVRRPRAETRKQCWSVKLSFRETPPPKDAITFLNSAPSWGPDIQAHEAGVGTFHIQAITLGSGVALLGGVAL